MNKKITALLISVMFLLVGCTTVPETHNPIGNQNKVSSKEHCNDVITYLSESKYVFFESFSDSKNFDVTFKKDNDEYNGTLKADFAENRYAFDCNMLVNSGEEYESFKLNAVYGGNNAYIRADGINELHLKTAQDDYIDTAPLRALYGICRLTESAFLNDIENYYRIIETDDSDATVASLSIYGEDVKKHAESGDFGEKYGFDSESIDLNCNVSLKTAKEGKDALIVTDFKIDSSLSYTANGRYCSFVLEHSESVFNCVFAVYTDSDKTEKRAEYILTAENGSGSLTLNGEMREMDTNGYTNAPEGFKCHTLEIPFEYSEIENPELNGYNVIIKRIRFKGEALELQSNTATTADDGEFVFGTDTDVSISFIRQTDIGGYRISGFANNLHFQIQESTSQSHDIDISLPELYTEDKDAFFGELYEKSPAFCEKIGLRDKTLNPDDVIEITDGYGKYIFYLSENFGSYSTTYTMDTDSAKFADGRTLPFTYEIITRNEETGEYTALINGMTFHFGEYTDSNGKLCQVLECTDTIENYPETAILYYYPELEHGEIKMGFVFKADGDAYTMTFIDGHTETKTLVYDEVLGEYTIKE